MSNEHIESHESNEQTTAKAGFLSALAARLHRRREAENAQNEATVEAAADDVCAAEAEVVATEAAAEAADVADVAEGAAPVAGEFDNYDFNVNGAGYAPQGVISRNAPRQLKPFGKVVACTLSVLLVLTTWNSVSIAEAREMIVGDEPVPMAPEPAADDNADDNADADADSNNDADNGDESQDAAESPYAAVADGTVSEADMEAYLPKDLLEADAVLPAISDKVQDKKAADTLNRATTKEEDLKKAFADRFQFSLGTAGALRASDNAYHVGMGRPVWKRGAEGRPPQTSLQGGLSSSYRAAGRRTQAVPPSSGSPSSFCSGSRASSASE